MAIKKMRYCVKLHFSDLAEFFFKKQESDPILVTKEFSFFYNGNARFDALWSIGSFPLLWGLIIAIITHKKKN